MKVLVTGSSGWLGRHLVPLLRDVGHEPFGIDPVSSPWTNVTGSVADKNFIEGLFKRHNFDGVIHGGALHKPDIVRYPQQAFIDVNVTGTLNLLEAASQRDDMRFVFTSTTSLMISQKIRDERTDEAVWLDETAGPLEPRNIYGVTKLAAEGLCRQHHLTRGLDTIVLRTSRFFPEEDDTLRDLSGPNMKANELLNRRATVRDMARAHITALEQAPKIGFGLYIVSTPTPFTRDQAVALKKDAAGVIKEIFPDAKEAYAKNKWHLPESIGRVYDGTKIMDDLGFTYETSFKNILASLESGNQPQLDHDASYSSPLLKT